jgi:hypothetical protein
MIRRKNHLYVQGFIELNLKYKAVIYIGSALGIFIMIARELGKDTIKDKNKDVMYNICLKVLDDIENEVKVEAEAMILNDEIAATVTGNEKHKQYISEGNFNISIGLPDVVSVAHGVLRGVRFVGEIFKKK